MSSNFSTNIPNLNVPGVAGRNPSGKFLFFKDYVFKPLSVKSRDGQIMILEQSQNFAYNMRGDSNGQFKMVETVLNTVFKTRPGLRCSNQAVYKVYWMLICYELMERIDYKMDVLYRYTIIMIDSSKNSVEFIGEFQNYYYKNPYIYFNYVNKKSDKDVMVFIINKLPEENEVLKFETNSRLSILHLQRKGRKYRMKDIIFSDMESLLFHSIHDSVSIRNLFFINQDYINILFQKKNPDYSISNKLFKCKIKFDLVQLSNFKFDNCKDFTPKNILYFKSSKYNSVHVDEEKKMHFCKRDNKDLDNVTCHTGTMNLEWEISYIDILKNVCVVIVKHFKKRYVFVYYFDLEFFTWFYSRSKFPHIRALVSRGQNDEVFLLIFIRKGFKIFDLTFEPNYSITSDNMNSTDLKIVYLEGHPMYRMNISLWNGYSIINYFNDKWWPVIFREDTKTYFEKLGFRGNNLSFQNDDLHTIYFFKATEFYKDDLAQILKYFNNNTGTINIKMYSNGTQDMLFILNKSAIIGKFYYDMKKNMNSLSNLREIEYPDDFEIDISRIANMDTRPFKFLVLLKNPYELISFNISSYTFYKFNMDPLLKIENISKCNLFVSNILFLTFRNSFLFVLKRTKN
jgi:hypothetical protein